MEAMLRGLFDGLALAAIVVTWVLAARAYPSLPERIPIHFGFDGKPDAWGGKGAIWLLPAVSTFVYLLNGVVIIIPGSDLPGEAFAVVMALLRLETAGLLLLIEWRMIEVARGRAEGLGAAIWIPIALVLATAMLLAFAAPRGGDRQRADAVRLSTPMVYYLAELPRKP